MQNSSTAPDPWFAYDPPQQNARLRLFCFPFAGGGAAFYRDWSQSLPLAADVCPVQLPGRETRMREPPLDRIEPLVEQADAALRPWLDVPYCLFGHSMGALVAFELARRFSTAHSRAPERLFVSGFSAPQLEYRSALRHDLPEDEFVEQLRRMEGTPKEVIGTPELMALLLPLLRADCAVCDFYHYEGAAPLPCPITVYGGDSDPETPFESLDAWRAQTGADFRLRCFPGGHFYLQTLRPAFLEVLGTELADIEEALNPPR